MFVITKTYNAEDNGKCFLEVAPNKKDKFGLCKNDYLDLVSMICPQTLLNASEPAFVPCR